MNEGQSLALDRPAHDRLPRRACGQISALLGGFRAELAENLVGAYLHGSLAMGCFNPRSSDVDLLVVIGDGMGLDTKRRVAETLLRSSGNPYPIEISFLTLSDLHPWRHPAPFDLHYSETWRTQYEEDLAGGAWKRWNEERRRDPDLAAHVTIVRARGMLLYGQNVDQVFPVVPRSDYIDSIMGDFREARDRIEEMPVYAVLNLCRVYWYLVDGAVGSKDEAGAWALATLPPEIQGVVSTALSAYRGQHTPAFDPGALRRFALALDQSVQAEL